jgi:hypothetical protein
MRGRPRTAAIAGLCASAVLAALVVVGTRGRPAALCAGGCMTHGIPVPMQGAEQPIHHSKAKMLAQQAVAADAKKAARVQQLDAYSYEDWSNAVQIGEKDHEWHAYEPDVSVMGKPCKS